MGLLWAFNILPHWVSVGSSYNWAVIRLSHVAGPQMGQLPDNWALVNQVLVHWASNGQAQLLLVVILVGLMVIGSQMGLIPVIGP